MHRSRVVIILSDVPNCTKNLTRSSNFEGIGSLLKTEYIYIYIYILSLLTKGLSKAQDMESCSMAPIDAVNHSSSKGRQKMLQIGPGSEEK